MVNVELIFSEDQRLSSFLEKNEHLLFHTPAYARFISPAFQCEYRFVAAIENDLVMTILPIVEVKSSIFGKRIISAPYLEYGGFAGDEKYILSILEWLAQKYQSSFDYLEIRGGMELFDTVLSSAMIKQNLYKRFVLSLTGKDQVWDNIQKSKRKAIKKSLSLVEVRDINLSELNSLYSLYCRNMRRFGSPPYNKEYFVHFYHHLVEKGQGKIIGAYHHGKLVAALLGLCYRDRVHIIIAVSDPVYQELRPNDAVHWKFIEWASDHGFKWFDFGRVREESGQFEYKQKWGPILLDLPSYFLIWNGKDIPEVDPKKYNLVVKLWRYMPLRVTKIVGHRLRKELGI